jgi:hypothetical protein
MPAYFSINIGIKKKDIYEGIYADFIGLLLRKDLRFIGGYLEFMDEPLEDIIAWNEKKLSADFSIEPDEHYRENYRQACFDYHNFSEVRLYILNNKEEDEIDFVMITPEDELIRYKEGRFSYNPGIMAEIKDLIISIWDFSGVTAIQTSLELSGDTASINELEEGERPSIYPYAIIPEEYLRMYYGDNVTATRLDGDGVILEEL